MTVFFKLMHGRDDPNQDMQDWGFDGPVLGPFLAIHVTYRDHIRCISADADEVELGFTDDLLTYDGKYYGDFEIAAGFGEPSRPLPPDPERMNAKRAAWAWAALLEFQRMTGTDHEDSLGDLLCDLMHWSDRANFDFALALDRARGHYEAETSPDGDA